MFKNFIEEYEYNDEPISFNLNEHVSELYEIFEYMPFSISEAGALPAAGPVDPAMMGAIPPPGGGAMMPPDPSMMGGTGMGMDPAMMGMGGAPMGPPAPPPPQIGPMIDPGTGLQIPPKIDPITGLEIPRLPTVGNATDVSMGAPVLLRDLDKLREMQKIHEYLLNIRKLLEREVDIKYEKVNDYLKDSLKYFNMVVRNMDSFTNFIDDIIKKYKDFVYIVVSEIKNLKDYEKKESKEKKEDKKLPDGIKNTFMGEKLPNDYFDDTEDDEEKKKEEKYKSMIEDLIKEN